MDTWSDNQLQSMKLGGNKRLKDLLAEFNISNEKKDSLFKSKLLEYHRKSLKYEINNNNEFPEKPELDDSLIPIDKPSPSGSGSFDMKTNYTSSGFKRFNSVSCEDTKFSSRFSLFNNDIDKKQLMNKYHTNNIEIDIADDISFHDFNNEYSVSKVKCQSSHNIVHNLAVKASKGVDYLFGNETEARCFAKFQLKLDTEDVPEIAKALSELEKKNPSRPRVVVITQGSEPTVMAIKGSPLKQFPVKKPLQIVDTNGAGDSFVGGFLAYLALGKSHSDAIQAGAYCAYECIQQSGCTFPEKPLFDPATFVV